MEEFNINITIRQFSPKIKKKIKTRDSTVCDAPDESVQTLLLFEISLSTRLIITHEHSGCT